MNRFKLFSMFTILVIIVLVGRPTFADGFMINQSANTSHGNILRYIDISSPWSGYYIFEDFVVEGRAEINDSFRMINIGCGFDNPVNTNRQMSDNLGQRNLPAFHESFDSGLSIGNANDRDYPVRSWLSYF